GPAVDTPRVVSPGASPGRYDGRAIRHLPPEEFGSGDKPMSRWYFDALMQNRIKFQTLDFSARNLIRSELKNCHRPLDALDAVPAVSDRAREAKNALGRLIA